MSASAAEHEPIETTEPDETNVGLIATVTIVGAILVVSTAASLTALVRTESSEWGTEIGAYANLGTVKRLKAEQLAKLEANPSWSDKSKGLVTLPIDRAMGLVTGELAKNPNLATPEALATAAPAAAVGQPAPTEGQPSPTGQAEPAPSAAAPGKDERPVPAKEKDQKAEKKAHSGDAKGPVKVEAPKGVPVAPAGAPAPHE